MTGRRGGDLVRDDVTRLQIDTAGNVDRSERQFEPSRKTEEMVEKKIEGCEARNGKLLAALDGSRSIGHNFSSPQKKIKFM
jgi:hypothetical protein